MIELQPRTGWVDKETRQEGALRSDEVGGPRTGVSGNRERVL